MLRRLFAAVVSITAIVGLLPANATADNQPVPGDPATVGAAPLPTVQINGVVWSQTVIGNTVYAVGSFSAARPAGSPAGTNESPRANILAFDITTGVLNGVFKPTVNGQILSIARSPDGSRVYIGGQFTAVNGQTRNRLAALNAVTGDLISGFAPSVGSTVRAVIANGTAVYFGGDFTSVDGQSRPRLAAVSTSGVLQPWNPKADKQVLAMTFNPGATLVVVGGRFTTIGTSAWYGMAAIDANPAGAGAAKPWAMEKTVRTAGPNAAVMSLASDGDSVYGTSYTYGSGGNFEGTWRARGSDGAVAWLADCHGDTYSVWPMGDAIYDTSHHHYCGNTPDGFFESNPRSYYHSTSFTKAVAGTTTYNANYGYPSFAGQPAPRLLHWYPVWSVGQYTGQLQAGWSVTGNGTYVVYGGEFIAVNGKAQQGLVRFAVGGGTNNAPPQRSDSLTPAAVSAKSGQVTVGWQAAYDRDNRNLTYKLYRGSALINTQTVASTTWRRPTISFVDDAAGSGALTYKVVVSDPWGSSVTSGTTNVTVASAANAYAKAVLDSAPEHWYRMNDATGTVLRDSRGADHATAPAAITGSTAGAVAGGGTAMTLSGSATAYAASSVSQIAPKAATVEAWIKTTTTSGGRIVGFGDRWQGSSKSAFTDRHLYMDNAGYVYFGVATPTRVTVRSKQPLNNNAWHHLVGSIGSDGLRLSVDGQLASANPSVTTALDSMGHWRIGGDVLDGWTSRPTSNAFAGSVDEVAIYNRVLSSGEVAGHYGAR